MSNENITLCRMMLSMTMERVRPFTTAELRKKAWVYKTGRQQWEFQAPNPEGAINEFYWFGHADNAYDAKAKGWDAWMQKYHPDQEEDA